MSKKTQHSLAALLFTGDDALAFCQAQMANNLLDLKVGQWQWSALLSAQGRVQALGIAVLLSQQCVLLVLPEQRASEIQAHLQRYLFRSRVQITQSELPFGFRLQPSSSVKQVGCALETSLESGSIHAVDGALLDICWPAHPSETMLTSDAIHLLARAGLPWLDDALANRYTGHMLGLQRLGAISISKGCYPGQEIVARTHYLGKSARHLRRVWCEQDLSSLLFNKLVRETADESSGLETVGELIQWSPRSDSKAALGLAVVRQDAVATAWMQGSLIAVNLDAVEAGSSTGGDRSGTNEN